MDTITEVEFEEENYLLAEQQQLLLLHKAIPPNQQSENAAAEMEIIDLKKPHPLLIDHVIAKIVRYLVADQEDETVLRLRLVCQVWNKVATHTLRSHSNRTVYFGKYFENSKPLLDYMHYLKSSSAPDHFPVGKFYLCEDMFKTSNLQKVPMTQGVSFFIDCANLVTSLTIRLDAQRDLKVSELNFVRLHLPNLKSLVLDDCRLFENITTKNDSLSLNNDNPSSVSYLLEGLVKCSPNLQSLTVIHPPSSMFDDEETASIRRTASEQCVAQMLKNHCPRNLTSLSLDIKLNDKVLVTLSQIPVNLTELQLHLRESIFSKESLHKLLDANKTSLKSLSFLSMSIKSRFEIYFPVLPKLKTLELHSWDSLIRGVTLSKFTCQANFPSLKSLVMNAWAENSSWIQFFPAAYYGAVGSMQSLKLPQNFMYPALIQNLAWLYPNLTKMDLHFSKDTSTIVQKVFAHFGEHLEELKIRDSFPRGKTEFCADSLFIGLPKLICEKILTNKIFEKESEMIKLLMTKQQPCLLNLKKLRKLDIQDMLKYENYVTDVTGCLVLLEMPALQYLKMGRSQIADDCLIQLAQRFPRNMQKELEAPKPLPRRTTNSATSLMLTCTPSSIINAYNYYCSTDSVEICRIC